MSQSQQTHQMHQSEEAFKEYTFEAKKLKFRINTQKQGLSYGQIMYVESEKEIRFNNGENYPVITEGGIKIIEDKKHGKIELQEKIKQLNAIKEDFVIADEDEQEIVFTVLDYERKKLYVGCLKCEKIDTDTFTTEDVHSLFSTISNIIETSFDQEKSGPPNLLLQYVNEEQYHVTINIKINTKRKNNHVRFDVDLNLHEESEQIMSKELEILQKQQLVQGLESKINNAVGALKQEIKVLREKIEQGYPSNVPQNPIPDQQGIFERLDSLEKQTQEQITDLKQGLSEIRQQLKQSANKQQDPQGIQPGQSQDQIRLSSINQKIQDLQASLTKLQETQQTQQTTQSSSQSGSRIGTQVTQTFPPSQFGQGQFGQFQSSQQQLRETNQFPQPQPQLQQLQQQITDLKNQSQEDYKKIKTDLEQLKDQIRKAGPELVLPQMNTQNFQIGKFNQAEQMYFTNISDQNYSQSQFEFIVEDDEQPFSIGIIQDGDLENQDSKVKFLQIQFPSGQLIRGEEDPINFLPRQFLRNDRVQMKVLKEKELFMVTLNGIDIPPIKIKEDLSNQHAFVIKSEYPLQNIISQDGES